MLVIWKSNRRGFDEEDTLNERTDFLHNSQGGDRQVGGYCIHRIVQRQLTGRVFECKLVSISGRYQGKDRNLATRLQRLEPNWFT